MKFIKSSIFFLPILFLVSCNGNTSTAPGKNNDDIKSSVSTDQAGNASFSCVVDGQSVSGGDIDPVRFYNTANIQDVDQGKGLLFYLTDTKTTETGSSFTHTLRFSVPDKAGSSSFGPEEDGWGIQVDINKGNGKTATYFSDSFVINITNLSSTRIAGTFSGTFKLRQDALSADYKKEIEVNDGKFNIPIAK